MPRKTPAEYGKKWRDNFKANDPDGFYRWKKNKHMKYMYGISLDIYEQILQDQKGVCAICNHINKKGQALSVDHDHKTGQLRQLLCKKCNAALGQMNDDPELLRAAAEYLEKHNAV